MLSAALVALALTAAVSGWGRYDVPQAVFRPCASNAVAGSVWTPAEVIHFCDDEDRLSTIQQKAVGFFDAGNGKAILLDASLRRYDAKENLSRVRPVNLEIVGPITSHYCLRPQRYLPRRCVAKIPKPDGYAGRISNVGSCRKVVVSDYRRFKIDVWPQLPLGTSFGNAHLPFDKLSILVSDAQSGITSLLGGLRVHERFFGHVGATFSFMRSRSRVERSHDSGDHGHAAKPQAPSANPCLLVGVDGRCVGGIRRTSLLYQVVCLQAVLLFGFLTAFGAFRADRSLEGGKSLWLALSSASAVTFFLFLVAGVTGEIWLLGI